MTAVAWLPPGCARAADPQPLLTRLARDLFPHPALEDAVYAALASSHLVRVGEQGGDRWWERFDPSGSFAGAAEPERKQRIEAAFADAGLQGFRFHVLTGLYTDLSVTSGFGYEGPSLEQGGWIGRGFDDLAWLPEPS